MSCVILLCSVAPRASAQLLRHDVLVEIARLNARQSTGVDASATMAAALASAVWPHLTTEAYAVLVSASSQNEGNASASQFGARTELHLPRISFAATEVAASLTRFGALENGRGSQSTVIARQHVRRHNGGFFLSGGRAWAHRESERAGASNVETGVWGTRKNTTASATVQRALTTDWQLMEAADYFLIAPARAYHVEDLAIELRTQRSRASAYVLQSWRRGVGSTSGSGRATTAGATWHVLSHWSVSGTVGSQLADVLRGLPAAQIRTLSLRWQRAPLRLGLAGPVRDRVRAAVTRADAPLREASLETDDSGSQLVLRIDAFPDAIVEIAGTFNDWRPVPLAHNGTQFTLRLPLSSGTHRIAVRVNGGAWRAVTGFARVDDGLGGANSLIVVP